MEEPSGDGNGERSRRVMRVLAKEGRSEREWAVESPKTPCPRIRIDLGVIGIAIVYML